MESFKLRAIETSLDKIGSFFYYYYYRGYFKTGKSSGVFSEASPLLKYEDEKV
jgi:hypothetical protein